MTDNTQPEALDLADWLEAVGDGLSTKRCAALLREQHARIAELEQEVAHTDSLLGRANALASIRAHRIAELEAQLESAGFTAADMATASAQGFRDGVASVAASAGSEPVAWIWKYANGEEEVVFVRPERVKDMHPDTHDMPSKITPLYLHPSPPEGIVGGWTKASQQLPPCRDDQLYIGVNTAGFVGVFNAVTDIAGDVHCHYETAEECIDVMSNLDIWQPFTPPTSSADSRKGD